jgi:hypothetical protein
MVYFWGQLEIYLRLVSSATEKSRKGRRIFFFLLCTMILEVLCPYCSAAAKPDGRAAVGSVVDDGDVIRRGSCA